MKSEEDEGVPASRPEASVPPVTELEAGSRGVLRTGRLGSVQPWVHHRTMDPRRNLFLGVVCPSSFWKSGPLGMGR